MAKKSSGGCFAVFILGVIVWLCYGAYVWLAEVERTTWIIVFVVICAIVSTWIVSTNRKIKLEAEAERRRREIQMAMAKTEELRRLVSEIDKCLFSGRTDEVRALIGDALYECHTKVITDQELRMSGTAFKAPQNAVTLKVLKALAKKYDVPVRGDTDGC